MVESRKEETDESVDRNIDKVKRQVAPCLSVLLSNANVVDRALSSSGRHFCATPHASSLQESGLFSLQRHAATFLPIPSSSVTRPVTCQATAKKVALGATAATAYHVHSLSYLL
jgi:hypothetical protein